MPRLAENLECGFGVYAPQFLQYIFGLVEDTPPAGATEKNKM